MSVHNFFSFILPTEDKEKSQDVAKEGANIAEEEHKDSSEGDNTPIVASLLPKKKRKDVAKEGAKIAEEEQKDSGEGDNTPIVASLLPKKKKKRKESTQRWEYVSAIDSASTYWDKGVEGKRQRTIANSSYCDDDARSDSESDPEDLFKPNKEDDASSDSDEAISAKDKVTLPLPHFPHSTAFFPNFASSLSS